MLSGNGRADRKIRVDEHLNSGLRVLGRQFSGQRFVIVSLVVMVLVWGGLYLAFLAWRGRYREQTAFARSQIPPVVDGLLRARPPDVPEPEWRLIVHQTRSMLDMLMGANLLDRVSILALRADLMTRVSSSRPTTALNDVIRIWSDMKFRAGPSLTRAERPALIDLAIVADSLERLLPPDVPRAVWSSAVAETRTMLVQCARSDGLDDELRDALRKRWTDMSLTARDRPTQAVDVLRQIWIDVEREPLRVSAPRPALLQEPSQNR
jgi:hypothetical protein